MKHEDLFNKELDCLIFILQEIKEATRKQHFGCLQQLTDRYIDLRKAIFPDNGDLEITGAAIPIEINDVILDRIKLTNEDLKVSEQRVFTDKELLDGWAFRSYEKEGQEYCARRYKEIKESGAEIKLNKRPCYGRCEYTGELLNDAAKALSRSDIAIWADQGNLCFGGHLIRSGDKFSGSYNTD